MRLYLDEDIASKELVSRLSGSPEVLVTRRGETDRRVWEQAQTDEAVVVTMNVKDFLALADRTSGHRGLLVVYRENDPRLDMRGADIAAAIDRMIDVVGGDLTGQTHVLNHFRG